MKKERLLYLDMIKLFAVICVFVCHFTGTLEYYGITFSFKILPDALFHLYTGDVGVTLFFIVSGATLMYVYENECSLKTYYRKRFTGIYPMFWITFIFAWCIRFFQYRSYDTTIPKYNILFSVLGIDSVMQIGTNIQTFRIIGEWFLGVIIVLYVIFPILRKYFLKYPMVFSLLVFIVGVCIDSAYSNAQVPINILFVVRIPEMVFGMIFVKYIKKVKTYMVLLSSIFLLIFTVFDLTFVRKMLQTYILGMSLFIVLTYLFSDMGGYWVQLISRFINKYCYAIFLVHHFLMYTFMERFNGIFLDWGGITILFISMCLLTILASYLIDRVTSFILGIFKNRGLG